MKIAINQPTYFPWVGYFDLIDQVDTYIFYDDVQIVKQSWGTRNRIMTSAGIQWLSVPLIQNQSHKSKYFNSTYIIENPIWKTKHFKSIKYAYSKARYYKELIFFMEELILNNKNKTLGDFNMHIIKSIANKIGINTEFISSSELNSKNKSKDFRLVDICKELNAIIYVSPIGSSSYIETNNDEGAFLNSGIKLKYHNYLHPIYNQVFKPFSSHLSIIDLLFNEGFNNTLKIIRDGRETLLSSKDLLKHQ